MVYISIGVNDLGDIVYCVAFTTRKSADDHRDRMISSMTHLGRWDVVATKLREE